MSFSFFFLSSVHGCGFISDAACKSAVSCEKKTATFRKLNVARRLRRCSNATGDAPPVPDTILSGSCSAANLLKRLVEPNPLRPSVFLLCIWQLCPPPPATSDSVCAPSPARPAGRLVRHLCLSTLPANITESVVTVIFDRQKPGHSNDTRSSLRDAWKSQL